jgi:hypothetical protein
VETVDEVIRAGARSYRDRLEAIEKSQASSAFDLARSALVESIDSALRLRIGLTPDDVAYSAGLCLPLLESGEWRYLDNQWSEGLGSLSPRVVAMGTEAANEPSKDLAWSSGSVILSLAGGSWEVAAELARGLEDDPWPHITELTAGIPPYARRPDRFLEQVHGWRLRPRHTWALLSDSLGIGHGDLGELFGSTYLIERSVYSSKRSSGGLPPTTDRVLFLKRMASALSQSASVLVVYGHVNSAVWEESLGNADTWDWTNREVTRSFLGVERLGEPAVHQVEGARRDQHIAVFTSGKHRAVWCRALSGQNVTDRYVAALRDIIAAGP